LRHRAIVLVGEIAAHAGEEESAEPAFFAVGTGEDLLFQELREESLGEILGIVRPLPEWRMKAYTGYQ